MKHKAKPHNNGEPLDRLPPNSYEAEQGVLGCMLIAPQIATPMAVEILGEDGAAFYDLRNQEIYRAVVEMIDQSTPLDFITLQQKLKDQGGLERVGGVVYLTSLPDLVPSAVNVDYYAAIVREKHLLRRIIQTCTSVAARVYEADGQVEEFLDQVEKEVMSISQARVTSDCSKASDLVHAAIATIENYHQRQGALTGLSTGFLDLDHLTSGLHGGEMIVIAGRPTSGKTSIVMNIAEHVAVDLNLPVGVFSLEMTADALMLRMLCSRARVNIRSMRDGFLAERDFPKLTSASARLNSAPLYIDDSNQMSVLQLRAKARRLTKLYGWKLIVVDYLQLLHSTNRKADSREQEVADVSGGIKALAKELNLPIIVLAQLNREVERRDGGKPRMSDLRESGRIEADADVVGLLYRAKNENEDEDDSGCSDNVAMNLLICKQRSGPAPVDINLTFLKGFTRFESASRVSSSDYEPDRRQTSMPYAD